MPTWQRPRDPRAVCCLLESPTAFDYIDLLDVTAADYGDGSPPVEVGYLARNLLHVDLPGSIRGDIEKVLTGAADRVVGQTYTGLDFILRPAAQE
jgi:hypothetical protein